MTYVKQEQKKIDRIKCKGDTEGLHPDDASLMAHYQRLLQLSNALDFNDLMDRTVRLLTTHPGIRQQLQRQRPFLLVDEFQDSNKAQTELVNLLQSGMQHVTVVGDDAQSIYAFRGAVPHVFEAYKLVYSHQDLVRPLELNYRSTPQILAVGKALLTEAGTEPKELRPTVPGEGKAPVRLLVLDTEEQEASVIAKEARRRHEQEGVPYSEMAVLFRAFNSQGGKAHTHTCSGALRVRVFRLCWCATPASWTGWRSRRCWHTSGWP